MELGTAGLLLNPVGSSAALPEPYPTPTVPGRASEELGGGRRKGPFPTCARTEWRPCGAATFTRPWYHATPTPASATPASDAATGPAATPRRSLSPQATSRAPRNAAAAIFAEASAPLHTRTLAPVDLARFAASAPPPAPAPWVRCVRFGAVERNTFCCRPAGWNWRNTEQPERPPIRG